MRGTITDAPACSQSAYDKKKYDDAKKMLSQLKVRGLRRGTGSPHITQFGAHASDAHPKRLA